MQKKDNKIQFQSLTNSMQRLISNIKQSKSTSYKSYIVALYTANDTNTLQYCGNIGMIQLDFDRSYKSYFLRLYDLNTLILIFQIELYYGFSDNFRKIQQTLYIFDYFSEGIIGLLFRSKQQAQQMAKLIKIKSPTIKQFKQIVKDRIKKQATQKNENTILNKVYKTFGKINNIFSNPPPHQQQSIIIDVKVQSSIKINYQTGQLNLQYLSPQFKQLLIQAGLKKQQFGNKQIAKAILQEIILHQAKKQIQKNPQIATPSNIKVIQNKLIQDDTSTTTSQPIQQSQPIKPKLSKKLSPPPPSHQLTNQQQSIKKNQHQPSKTNDQQTAKTNLLQQIRNNKLKLKSVKTTQKGLQINVSMDQEQRKDLAEHMKAMLQRRKNALNRRQADSDDENT